MKPQFERRDFSIKDNERVSVVDVIITQVTYHASRHPEKTFTLQISEVVDQEDVRRANVNLQRKGLKIESLRDIGNDESEISIRRIA